MERISSINFDRIGWCCEARGMSTGELAIELKIGESTWTRFQDGEIGLTFNQLKSIADYFGRSVFFFLESETPEETKIHSAQFRTLTSQKPDLTAKLAKIVEQTEKQREVYLTLREESGNEIEEFSPPSLDNIEASEKANVVREWLQLSGKKRFQDYRAAFEAKGILVFQTPGYKGDWQIAKESPVLGFSLYFSSYPIIVVKKLEPESRMIFTLAHELAHLVLHKSSWIDYETELHSDNRNEVEANAFAATLLVPDFLLSDISTATIPRTVQQYSEWLRPITRKLGVSTEVVLRRLVDRKLIAKSDYFKYHEWVKTLPSAAGSGGSREYRHREPAHMFGHQFVKAVFDALSEKRVSAAKASKYLDGLQLSDMRKLRDYSNAHA
jgi:Zn-dependent peptidase ImmA (M78 family)